MAKAHVKLPDGTVVRVEGTGQEISEFVQKLQGGGARARKGAQVQRVRHGQAGEKVSRPALVDLLGALIDGGFFKKKPQGLAAVKLALEEMGHCYPVTTLSGAMLTEVRKHNLRRLKQDKRWVYTE